MFKKKNQYYKKMYYYRVRGNNSQDYYNVPYVCVDDINSVGAIVDDFLSKNYVDIVTKNQPAYSKYLNNDMVVIGAYNQVLELDTFIYDKYKDKIESILSHNMYESIKNFSPYKGTRILVNYVTSGCDYEVTKISNQTLCDVSKKNGVKTIYISYDKTFDEQLFKMIILDLYGDFSVEPEVKFLTGVEVTLKLDDKFITLDWRAYELAIRLINERKKELISQDYPKKLQMKMEG